jgi:hypothetical protein
LKAYYGVEPTDSSMLPPVHHGRACFKLSAMIKSKMVRAMSVATDKR